VVEEADLQVFLWFHLVLWSQWLLCFVAGFAICLVFDLVAEAGRTSL